MKLSFSQIKQSLNALVVRFPATFIFSVLMLAVCYWLTMKCPGNELNSCELQKGFVTYFIGMGMCISLFFELWKEEVENKKRAWILYAVAIVVAAIDAFYLYHTVSAESTSKSFDSIFLARLAVFVAILCGTVCVSFLKNKNDVQLWNFSWRTCGAVIISLTISGILVGASALLIFGIDELFSADISSMWYLRSLLPFMVLLPVCLFLIRIPNENKHDDNLYGSKFYTGVTRYLFIPLTLCYLAVMYAYLFKILISWELPKGTVSWMVSVMMYGMIIVEVLLYHAVQQGVKSFECKMAKLFPWLMLPLLVLMSVAILRRVSDYGITTNRLYILLETFWFFVVCVYLIVNKNKRILWIPLTFCFLFLLSSAQPMNFFQLTKHIMSASVSKIIERNAPDSLPMNRETFDEWFTTLPANDKKKLSGEMYYLEREFGKKSTDQWVSFAMPYSYYDEETDDIDRVPGVAVENRESIYFSYDDSAALTVPQGYTKVQYITKYSGNDNYKMDSNHRFLLKFKTNHNILIDTAELRAKNGEQLILQTSDPNYIFIPTKLNIIGFDAKSEKFHPESINVNGYFFGK